MNRFPRFVTCFLSCIGLLLACQSTASAAEKELEYWIESSDRERVMTPTFLDWKDMVGAQKPLFIQLGSTNLPAQLVKDANGKTRLGWIAPRIAAGEKPRFKIVSWREQQAAQTFQWTLQTREGSKLVWNKKPVLEYVSTPHDPKRHEETKKPYHHIFDPSNGNIITKGLGGLYPHHRGIYFGYLKCEVDGKSWDTWHCKNGEFENNVKTIASWAGPVMGGHRTLIEWADPKGKAFAEETREVVVLNQDEKSVLIDFTTTVTAKSKPVKLGGDRRHCGVHFRAAQAVADNQKATRFIRPGKWADVPSDKELSDKQIQNLPWNAMSFPINGKTVTVAYIRSKTNPPNPQFDERLYGRFGEFVPYNLEAGKSITLRYRFWIVSGETPTRDEIEMRVRDFNDPPTIKVDSH